MRSARVLVIFLGGLLVSSVGCDSTQSGAEHVEEIRGVTIRYFHPPGMSHWSSHSQRNNDENRTIMDATGGSTPDMHVEFSLRPDMHLEVNSKDYGEVKAMDQVEIDYDREVRVNGKPRAPVAGPTSKES